MQFINGVSYIYDRPEAKTVVVFSHGNGGDLTHRSYGRDLFSDWSRDQSIGLIMYDYYGYGASQNVPLLLMNETALTRALSEVMTLVKDKTVVLHRGS